MRDINNEEPYDKTATKILYGMLPNTTSRLFYDALRSYTISMVGRRIIHCK
jgi:hypothetical protein